MNTKYKRTLKRRLNHLKRVLRAQQIYNQEWEKCENARFVWRNFIDPELNICYRTFCDWLSVNAKKEIKEIEDKLSNN